MSRPVWLRSKVELDSIPEYTESNERHAAVLARLDNQLLRERGLQIVAINGGSKTGRGQPNRLPDYVGEAVYWIAAIEGPPGAGFNHAVVMRGSELLTTPTHDLRSSAAGQG